MDYHWTDDVKDWYSFVLSKNKENPILQAIEPGLMQRNCEVKSILNVIKSHKFTTFLELGSGNGTMLKIVKKEAPEMDVIGFEFKNLPKIDGVDLRTNKNIFECHDEICEIIRSSPGPVFCYCDNGNKVKEIELMSHILRPGDVIGCHDFGVEVSHDSIKFLHEKGFTIMTECEPWIQEHFCLQRFWQCNRENRNMNNISYVIVAPPRSGTGYTAKIFDLLGLNCTHEGRFSPWNVEMFDQKLKTFGDASWMAVPYLDQLPPGTLVLHQYRNILDVANSNLKRSQTLSSLFNSMRLGQNFYSDFVLTRTRDWCWAATEKERVLQFVYGWHALISHAVTKRSDLRYISYNVEDLSSIDLVAKLAKAACPTCWGGKGPPLERVKTIVDQVPTNYNHQGATGVSITNDDLKTWEGKGYE